MKSKPNHATSRRPEEFADVLSYLLDLANCFQVDLSQANQAKNSSISPGHGNEGPLLDDAPEA